MNLNIGSARLTISYFDWFHVGIKLSPLTCPVSPDLFFPDYSTTFRCLRPVNVFTHQRKCVIDIPPVESRVDLSYECICIRHDSPEYKEPLACP